MSAYPFHVVVIDHKTGDTRFVVSPSKITNCAFSTKLNDIGVFVLAMVYDQSYFEQVKLDDFFEFYVEDNTGTLTKFDTYFMRGVETYIDDGVEYIVFSGKSLNDLIARRIVNLDDDSLAINGYVTIGDNAHAVMEHFADEHFINCSDASRNFPDLTSTELVANSVQVGIRTDRKNILEIFQQVATAGRTAFNIVRVATKQLQLQFGPLGTDKTKSSNYPSTPFVTLSPELGNVDEFSVENDASDTANYIYLLGEGEGASQQVTEYLTSAATLSFYNRIEFTKTSRTRGDYVKLQEILTEAINELQKKIPKLLIKYKISRANIQPNIVLGDYITLYWRGYEQDLQVIEIKVKVKPNSLIKELVVQPYVRA
jgi:hypothetical protein